MPGGRTGAHRGTSAWPVPFWATGTWSGAGTGTRRAGPRRAAPPPPVPPAPGPRVPAQPPGSRAAARHARAADRPDALRQLLPRALVVAFLAGGSYTYLAADKTVELTVDGVPRTLHTFADDVPELLDEEHVPVGDHDLVAPGRHAALHDGDTVAVRYGRPLDVTLDGTPQRLWTTARTVEEALRQLGVRADGAHLSASRSATIARHGLRLEVRTERTVTFLADGREHTVRTNAGTVREAARQAGISFGPHDTTSVDPDSFPRDGQTVSVLRITGTTHIREEPVPFRTVVHPDPDEFTGTRVVVTPGRPGVREVVYTQRTVNGVAERPRLVGFRLLRPPVDRVVRAGTRPLPTSVAGADHLNWSGLARCEAGGHPDAVDPSGTYGGLYQFDSRTWHALGGTGRPQDAPATEQTYRAKKLYVQRGAAAWPVCGGRLHH
ncbi:MULTISPECIES: resuscitation-promoting factor [Streptomycetaceae]|uniref:Transglycosylase domain-containing protein n=1 Tax=Streptantibioticus cattleyicolor (strain ATCC 35852 / DSM 46488 / JCM 4925 / NBRC 14057 / NRRL 8057) TaxID=1003195 RepID=F8JZS5_STREN|nr:resuscitation-promoting factor [Streptantibioticus cattleyicolor]AEW94504.1 transglycosylase domain-containing protein [Streptantibioticus cattleyicolor NRRL 8057 = DSM 46488]MYS59149.1 DUF348 domain-containing protein [Streptomyces sp. SID5468]CCB74862.1 conserved protein of unknown function [Streptantibioticus cattleyicolor NRRL 8057 = DSM 46488]